MAVVASSFAKNGMKVEGVVTLVGKDGEKNAWRSQTQVDGAGMATSHHDSYAAAEENASKTHGVYVSVHGGERS